MKKIFLTLILALCLMTSCSKEGEEADINEYTALAFSIDMTVEDIVDTARAMAVEEKEAEDFLYADQAFADKYMEPGYSLPKEPVAAYIMQLGEGFGIRIEAVYENEAPFSGEELSEIIQAMGFEDVFIRFYASDEIRREDVILCLLKAGQDLDYDPAKLDISGLQ